MTKNQPKLRPLTALDLVNPLLSISSGMGGGVSGAFEQLVNGNPEERQWAADTLSGALWSSLQRKGEVYIGEPSE